MSDPTPCGEPALDQPDDESSHCLECAMSDLIADVRAILEKPMYPGDLVDVVQAIREVLDDAEGM